MKVSLIISTYNSEEWLIKALAGISHQTYRDFELVIADDGSGPATRSLIEEISMTYPVPIIHVWQEDNGFQKTKILNKAILVASGDYLIFTDGDCILRNDFIASPVKSARSGYFLSGGILSCPWPFPKR